LPPLARCPQVYLQLELWKRHRPVVRGFVAILLLASSDEHTMDVGRFKTLSQPHRTSSWEYPDRREKGQHVILLSQIYRACEMTKITVKTALLLTISI